MLIPWQQQQSLLEIIEEKVPACCALSNADMKALKRSKISKTGFWVSLLSFCTAFSNIWLWSLEAEFQFSLQFSYEDEAANSGKHPIGCNAVTAIFCIPKPWILFRFKESCLISEVLKSGKSCACRKVTKALVLDIKIYRNCLVLIHFDC